MIFLPGILAFLEGVGGGEMVWVLLLALLLFGGDKLPGLAKGMGKAIREFKKAASDVEHEIKRAIDEAPEPTPHQLPTVFPPHPPQAVPTVAFPPLPDATSQDPAMPYQIAGDPQVADGLAPAPASGPVSEPSPGDKPPPPPAPPSPYEHLNDL